MPTISSYFARGVLYAEVRDLTPHPREQLVLMGLI